ncbi:MAG: rhomboid family intramembrane serine protease, partial [Giesbergeria sp.]
MFIAIPLEVKPSWRAPPWMTVLLICINLLVYWGWQVPEERAVARAAERYAVTDLPALELPAFVHHMKDKAARSGKARDKGYAEMLQAGLDKGAYAELYQVMWNDTPFRQRLLAEQVIRPSDANFAPWQAARAQWTPTEPAPFTARWANSYEAGDEWRPVTWLSAVFLHASAEHVLGNMVFLFLFGFTLEMVLGAPLYLLCYLLGGIGASAVAEWAYAGMGGYGLGASGAVSALMGMYVVLYRLRRIRFFYQFLFYFNYARWPALVMLPVWMGFELLQQALGGTHVAYMAHFGGLLTGALLMWGLMAVRPYTTPEARPESRAKPLAPGDSPELRPLVERAQKLTDALRFDEASRAWRQAAQLSPQSLHILQAGFECARHAPAGDDFHTAARLIFKLPAHDAATRQLQCQTYRRYLDLARPGIRMSADAMLRVLR